MPLPLKLEIAANSVASALAAQAGGADRVELCAALELGGVTPSYAQIALTRERLTIPLYVLIRPRGGNFRYNDEETETMLRDIECCVALGCDGVVIGVLDTDGAIDASRCQALIFAAKKLSVTFHRAIDVSRDPLLALEEIIALGCERVLSSGGATSAIEGAAVLKQMVERAAGRIQIMPGAGVRADNVQALRAATGATEFHASAKQVLPSGMRFTSNPRLGMSDSETRSNAEQVRRIAEALAALS